MVETFIAIRHRWANNASTCGTIQGKLKMYRDAGCSGVNLATEIPVTGNELQCSRSQQEVFVLVPGNPSVLTTQIIGAQSCVPFLRSAGCTHDPIQLSGGDRRTLAPSGPAYCPLPQASNTAWITSRGVRFDGSSCVAMQPICFCTGKVCCKVQLKGSSCRRGFICNTDCPRV